MTRSDVQNTLTADVDITGPLFTKDAEQAMWNNITSHYEQISQEGAEEARRGFARGQGGRSPVSALGDHVSDHIVGRIVARPSRGGRSWRAHGVVQVYAEGLDATQARSLMAAGSILEGRMGVIRTVTRNLARKIRQVDLTKGLD